MQCYVCTSANGISENTLDLISYNWHDKYLLLQKVAQDFNAKYDLLDTVWPLEFTIFEDESKQKCLAKGTVDRVFEVAFEVLDDESIDE